MTSGISFLPPTRKPSVLHCQMEGHFVQSMDTTGPGSRFLLSVGGRSSTPPFVPLALPPPSFGGGGCCLGRGGELPSEEGSNFSCGRPGVPGLLWSPVSCPKGFGRFPPGLGPLLPQPVSQPGEVQNGDPVLYQGGHSAGRLGLQNRPSGRLLPHYDRPSAQEVPPLHPQRSSVPVFLPGLRPSPGTLALHQSSKRVCNGAEGQRRSIASILGRLGSSQSVGGHVSLPYVFDGGFSSGVGVFNQLGEVGPCSQTEVRLLGNEVRHPLFCGKPVRGQAVQTEQVPGLSPLCSLSFCSQTNFPSRDPGITVSSSPPGPPSQAPVSEGVQGKVVSSQGGLEPADPVGQLVSLDHKNLEGPFLSRECGPDHSPQTGPDFVLGRLHPGLGGSPPGSHCIRSVGQRSALMAHKPLGTRGGFSGSPRVSSVSFGKTFVDSHRQHHGGVLHQQTGGGQVDKPLNSSGRASPLLPKPRHCSLSPSPGRKAQCPGRRLEPLKPGDSHRVDAVPQSPGVSLVQVSQTDAGPFRHKIFETSSDLCESGGGSRSPRGRRSLPLLVGSGSLRLPSPSFDPKGSEKSKGRAPLSSTSGSKVACAALVPGASGAHGRGSLPSTSGPKRPPPAPLGHSTREPRAPPLTRVALVRRRLRTLGASSHLQDSICASLRKSSSSVYEAHWTKWSLWCLKYKVKADSPTSVQLANFLAFLYFDKKLSASTVKSVRSAISSTIKQLGGPDFSDDLMIRDLLRGLSLKDHKSPRRTPAWDLFVVLSALRSSPFEPLTSCTLKFLSWKTAFLISLASGRRCSEVSNLSGLPADILWHRNGSVSLKFLPEFLAKNQSPGCASPSITISPLSSILCPDDEDRQLCPIRALKRYLRFTRTLRSPNQRKLFISHNPGYSKDITKATLGRWLRLVISKAYDSTSSDSLLSPRAHEIRAWASSLAFKTSLRLDDVLQAAYWKSKNSFISHYLRDVSAKAEDGTTRLSFVAAGQAVH